MYSLANESEGPGFVPGPPGMGAVIRRLLDGDVRVHPHLVVVFDRAAFLAPYSTVRVARIPSSWWLMISPPMSSTMMQPNS